MLFIYACKHINRALYVHSYSTSAIHAYTDESAFKATINAGFGILLKYPDGSSSEYSDSCGTNCSNYEAEKIAIKTAIQLIHQRFELSESNPTYVIIFSDAKSALEALQNPPHQDQITSEIALGISNLIAAHAVHVTLQWIPGHCNISGNEKADKLAKIGATKPQKIPPCTQNTIKQILKNNEKEDWLNRWACGSTGRVMFKEMAQPRPQDAINELERQDQSLIFQFRTQHTRTNQHLNRINPLHQPHCRHCDNPAETTEHLLLPCPNLQSKRMELLPTSTNPTIHSTLYGQLDQLKKTSTFIRLYKSEELNSLGSTTTTTTTCSMHLSKLNCKVIETIGSLTLFVKQRILRLESDNIRCYHKSYPR